MFERFFGIGDARDHGPGGVGLGPSVTRSIIWEHGGEISLGVRKGRGLADRIDLPIGTDANAPGQPGVRV